MSYFAEKAAYLKGLAEGLEIDGSAKQRHESAFHPVLFSPAFRHLHLVTLYHILVTLCNSILRKSML